VTPKLKPLHEQVIVITGASSGIGLATARQAARAGARLVLAARSDEALEQLVQEIHRAGGRAVHVTADVGVEEDVQLIADAAAREFNGFDTWVNNAGVSVYGHALEVPSRDMRRVFDTNFWGVVHGTRVACDTLRTRGGAIVNVGSEVSDRAVPLQAIYSASKHAVKGWTDALRTELQQMGAPISLTLIKPGPIDTPYTQHARNYLADQPTHVPPVYAPESVAEAILYAACTPVRDLFVGGAARMVATMNKISPRLADAVVGPAIGKGTHSGRPRGRVATRCSTPGDASRNGATTQAWCGRASTRRRPSTRCSRPPWRSAPACSSPPPGRRRWRERRAHGSPRREPSAPAAAGSPAAWVDERASRDRPPARPPGRSRAERLTARVRGRQIRRKS
jgi:short-subunit dehydrogenase